MNIDKYQFRYQIISLLDQGFYTALDAAWELNLSIRHVRRLLAKFRQGKKKISSLAPKSKSLVQNKIEITIEKEIVRLKKENLLRSNQHIAELVENKLLKKISYQTVRSVLIRNDCYEKTKVKRRVFKNLEKKITRCGQMVQFDVCEGAWVKGYRRVYLIAFMDAYSRYIVGWNWVNSDNAWNNICVLRSMVLKYGVPELFYTDNASFYKVIRHNNSIYQKHKPDDEYETTIQRIILDLESVMVNHKPYEPQGKGRIERFFRFMQDRFILEHTAKNLEELNEQFVIWIKWYNTKHIIRTTKCVPKDRFNPRKFKPVRKDLVKEKVFSYQYTRKVDKYNSFSFEGSNYIIEPKNCKHFNGCLTSCRVQLYVSDKAIVVYHRNNRIQEFVKLSKKSK
jgi:putative transposase